MNFIAPMMPFPASQYEGLIVMQGDNIPTPDIQQAVLMSINGKNLVEYLQEKHHWNTATFNMINWEDMRKTLDISKHTQSFNYVKLIHDWQNNGKQKYLFETRK